MSPFEFLLESSEFKIFSRPNGDIEKLLGNMPKMNTMETVEKYKDALNIEYHLYDPIMKDKLNTQCQEFQHFSKQIIPILKTMVTHIALYMSNKSQSIQDYKVFMQMLNKYEELNLAMYVDGNNDKQVFENKEGKEGSSETIKDSCTNMCDSLKNPFFNLYHWCKGELFDIEAVNNCLTSKDKLYARIGNTEKKKKSTQSDLDNVTTGRKTIGTMFKNKNDTGSMVTKIEAVSTVKQFNSFINVFK